MTRQPYPAGPGRPRVDHFEPQAGREQSKNRPGLVLTEREFNLATGLVIACPIINGSRVRLSNTATQGFVMVEQVKSIDWRARVLHSSRRRHVPFWMM